MVSFRSGRCSGSRARSEFRAFHAPLFHFLRSLSFSRGHIGVEMLRRELRWLLLPSPCPFCLFPGACGIFLGSLAELRLIQHRDIYSLETVRHVAFASPVAPYRGRAKRAIACRVRRVVSLAFVKGP